MRTYRATKRVRTVGKGTTIVSLDKAWGFARGDLVEITVRRKDDDTGVGDKEED